MDNNYRYIPGYTKSSTATAPELQPNVYRRPIVRVRPGGQQGIKGFGFKHSARNVVIAAIVCAVLFFVATAIRLSLYSASVNISLETSNIETQIKSAYGETSTLGIQRSTAENSTKIKEEATKLGMSRQLNTDTINIKPDVATLDNKGKLSIAKSIMKAGLNNFQA
ncbi:MAG: hypothetical protein HUJ51_03540 [Eggerthellaceae bacterium]|nr:hypothetical protein [Eggerthellaceae bacterium]